MFSPDGRLLFATENDFDAGEGRIGVYDATGAFKRIGEFATYGVGPHDLALLADGTTLVIANGGVATHPDIGDGRIPLNLVSMTPSLAYVDLRSTDLIENHSLPRLHHQASLRHLDAGRGSRLVIGCQSRAADGSEQPLVLIHQRGEALTPVRLEARTAAAMRNYVSSVAIDASGEIAAVTSAKGGLAVFLDVASGRVLGSRSLADVSGVAVGAAKQTFLLTSGEGDILAGATPETTASQTKTLWNWDNHAVKL